MAFLITGQVELGGDRAKGRGKEKEGGIWKAQLRPVRDGDDNTF